MAVAALRIAAQHLDALPQPDLAAFTVYCMRAGLPEQAAMAASRAPEELTALVAVLRGNPDKVPSALEAGGGLTMAFALDTLPSRAVVAQATLNLYCVRALVLYQRALPA